MLHTGSKTLNYATEQPNMHCQYCYSADHWSSTFPQTELCPTCRTKTIVYHICPFLRDIKGQERDYKGYKDNELSLSYSKVAHWRKVIQVTPVIVLSIPVFDLTYHVHPHNLCFDDEFSRRSSTPGRTVGNVKS